MRGAYSPLWNEGDMAMVTTRSGIQYIAVYTLAPGIDYFWNPIPGQPKVSSLVDPDVAAAPLTDEERAAAEAAIQAKKDQQYNFLMDTTDEETYTLPEAEEWVDVRPLQRGELENLLGLKLHDHQWERVKRYVRYREVR